MDDQNQVELYSRGHRLDRRGPGALDSRVLELPDSYEILEPGEALDLRSYGRILRKRLPTILVVFFILFTGILIATLKQKPVYRAQVLLEIQKENPDIPTIKEMYELDAVSDAYLRTQYSILASESLARRVIEPAIVLAYVVFFIETIGAVLIILGLFTRFIAAAAAIEFAIITFLAHWPVGFSFSRGGWEYPLFWGLILFAIALRGGGPYSLDRKLGWEL